jgi:hypothetical protein
MNLQHEVKLYSLSAISLLLCLLACALNVTASLRRGQMQENPPEAVMRQRIAVLMSNTLREREKIAPNGVKVWAPVPLSHEALEEIKGYGDKAAPILAGYLKSGAYQERELAMLFFSHLGGSRMVESLLTVIRSDPEPNLRTIALTYLSQAPWEVASPILREVSKVDRDPRVRDKAEYILKSHEARELKSPSESVIRKRIASMMDYILKRAETVTPDGIKVQIVARPSNEEIEEIKSYGDDAVPVLSEYLSAEDSRQKLLALRFLGILGGGRIIEPLEKVIRSDPSPSTRETALIWLAEAPWDLASPIIQQAAQNDPDAAVRQTARGLLDDRKPK